MRNAQSKFLDRILEPAGEGAKSYTSERQLTAQAFNLHVERRDGRRSEGFPWAHYAGYQWTDEGSHERLVLMFGARALEIEGHQLGALVNEIRDGQLNSVRELTTAQRTLLERDNPDNEPVITSVRSYPDIDEMLKEIKGEDERETRFAKRLER
jgi:hypothetical protein